MEHEIKCEKCNSLMHQIGPFASSMNEGQSAKKWDGFTDFECINQECENVGVIIKLKI